MELFQDLVHVQLVVHRDIGPEEVEALAVEEGGDLAALSVCGTANRVKSGGLYKWDGRTVAPNDQTFAGGPKGSIRVVSGLRKMGVPSG